MELGAGRAPKARRWRPRRRRRGWGFGRGYPPLEWGSVWGGACAPPDFFILFLGMVRFACNL